MTHAGQRPESVPAAATIAALMAIAIVTAAGSPLPPGEGAKTVVAVTNGALGLISGPLDAYTRSMVSIAGAAFTAVTAVIAAYFGVNAAGLAREDPERRGEDHALQVAHLVGAMDPDKAQQAIDTAIDKIRQLREG